MPEPKDSSHSRNSRRFSADLRSTMDGPSSAGWADLPRTAARYLLNLQTSIAIHGSPLYVVFHAETALTFAAYWAFLQHHSNHTALRTLRGLAP